MNEEEFLENHPSLKGKSVWTSIDESDSARFSGKDIHETQLDKQKVKEVVTAYLCKYVCRDDRIKKLRDGILNELG